MNEGNRGHGTPWPRKVSRDTVATVSWPRRPGTSWPQCLVTPPWVQAGAQQEQAGAATGAGARGATTAATGHGSVARSMYPGSPRTQLRTHVSHDTNTEHDFPLRGIHQGLTPPTSDPGPDPYTDPYHDCNDRRRGSGRRGKSHRPCHGAAY